jgi:hypothetical protein
MKGPAIFLAQFAGEKPPFDKLGTMAQWATEQLKHPEDGAREGAPFIRAQMIRKTPQAFDDLAAGSADAQVLARILGRDQQ